MGEGVNGVEGILVSTKSMDTEREREYSKVMLNENSNTQITPNYIINKVS